MGTLGVMLQNRWTTLVGLAGGIAVYMQGAGAKFPETKAEWSTFVYGLAIVVLGFAAKDATTGSAPK